MANTNTNEISEDVKKMAAEILADKIFNAMNDHHVPTAKTKRFTVTEKKAVMDPYKTIFKFDQTYSMTRVLNAFIKDRITFASTSNEVSFPLGSKAFTTPGQMMYFSTTDGDIFGSGEVEIEFSNKIDRYNHGKLPIGRWCCIYLGNQHADKCFGGEEGLHYYELIMNGVEKPHKKYKANSKPMGDPAKQDPKEKINLQVKDLQSKILNNNASKSMQQNTKYKPKQSTPPTETMSMARQICKM